MFLLCVFCFLGYISALDVALVNTELHHDPLWSLAFERHRCCPLPNWWIHFVSSKCQAQSRQPGEKRQGKLKSSW